MKPKYLFALVVLITAEAVIAGKARAQNAVLPYSIQSSTQTKVGDGSAGSLPMPVSVTGSVPASSIYVYTPLGCFQLTSLATATNLPTPPAGAKLVNLTIESEGVRYRDDGTAPTASIGELLQPGGPWPYSGTLTAIQFIQVGASAVIDGCFYK